MTVYFVALVDIADVQEFALYEQCFMDIFKRYGGQILAADDSPAVLEGEWPHTRTVLMSFPSSGELDRWYHSPEYRAISQHRHKASEANIAVIKGLG